MGVKTKKTTLSSVVALLQKHELAKAEAEALMIEHGITKKLEKAAELKKQATELVLQSDLTSVPMPDGTRYDLRRDTYNKQVVGDDEQLADLKTPAGVIPLKTIIKAKFGKGSKKTLPWTEIWKQVTTRRVDIAKLEDAVKKDVLTVDEIQPAYYSDSKSPYLRKV